MSNIVTFEQVRELLEKNEFDILDKLIENGLDINNLRDHHGKTLLMHFCYISPMTYHESMRSNDIRTQYLLSHGADINATDKYGRSALFYHYDLIYFIDEYNIDTSIVDITGKTALFYIFDTIKNEVLLILKHFNINATDNKGCNIFHYLAKCGKYTCSFAKNKYLSIFSHLLDAKDKYGRLPSHYGFKYIHKGISRSNDEKSKCFVEDHNRYATKDIYGRTALFYHPELVSFDDISEYNYDPNKTDIYGQTSVFVIEDLKLLTEIVEYCDASVKIRDNHNRSPLYFAKSAAKAKFLIDYGCSVFDKDDKGRTPLHYASNPIVADIMVKVLADIDAKDNEGKTPLDTIKDKNTIEFLKTFKAMQDKEFGE